MPGGDVPLTFEARLPWPLEREPVTVGVPFPPSTLGEPAEACVFDGDAELYCQRQVLSQWPDGSVRWLLLDFQVDLPAAAAKTLRLVYGQGRTGAVLDDTGISLAEDRRQLTVDTGPLRFTWRTRPLRLFETVHVEGEEVLAAREPADFFTVDLAGRAYRLSECRLPSVTAETSGPLRAAVRLQGTHLDEDEHGALDFDLLLTAWSGKPWVTLDYQVVHRGGEAVAEVHEAAFRVDLSPRGAARLASGVGGVTGSCPGVQVSREEETLTVEVARKPTVAGGRPERLGGTPWVDRSEPGRGLAVGVRHGVEQFPKRLTAGPSQVVSALYPAGEAPLRLSQGMAKSHELMAWFHDGQAGAGDLGRRFQLFARPLRPRLAAAWYDQARAFGSRFPTRPLFQLDVALDEALDRRPRAMGLLHFGDEPHPAVSPEPPDAVAWSNNACDLACACLLHYARAGRPRHFADAEAVVRHVVDVDHVHFSPDPLVDGGLAPPGAGHRGDGPVSPAHQWVEGLLACHQLTGRQRPLLAARRIGENVLRHVPHLTEAPSGEADFAALGWALYTVATLYRELGRPQYFDAARRLLDRLARCAAGPNGLACTCAAQCSHQRPCTVAVVLTGLHRYHRVSKEQRAGDLFLRVLDALVDGGEEALWRHTCLPRPWPDLQADALLLDPLAFAWELTDAARYLELGRPLVRHLVGGGLRLSGRPALDLRQVGDAVLCQPVLAPPSGLAIAQVVRPLLAYLAACEAAGLLDTLDLA